jgi:hypothetical protein
MDEVDGAFAFPSTIPSAVFLFRACNRTPFGNGRVGVFWRVGKHCATYGE